MTLSPAVLEKLRRFDTPTICNVIELFRIRPFNTGYMDGRIRACYPKLPPMVGYASTATIRTAAPPKAGGTYSGLAQQIELLGNCSGPAIVVFQDLDDPATAATFGEVMCTTYKAFGCAGLITSGAARDLDQVAALNFPCFSNGIICAHGYSHIPQINIPIRVGGIMIHPGDLLHGDCNGITSIPSEIASDVADACPEYMAAEAVMIEYAKSGQVNSKGFADARKKCQQQIEALGRRLGKI